MATTFELYNGQNLAVTKTSTTPYSVQPYDQVILVTTGASAFTVTLQLAAQAQQGKKILIIKADSGAGAITVNVSGGDTIEGSTSKTISAQYGKVGLISDGVSLWYDLATGGV